MASLGAPVLALALDNIHKINKLDSDNLRSMWTVFTKCKESLEHGRRLENISWRLWYRETMLHEKRESQGSPTTPKDLTNTVPISPVEGNRQSEAAGEPKPEYAMTKQFSTFSFRKIITSFIPAGADASNWKALKETAQKKTLSAPTVNALKPTLASVTEVLTNSLPDMRSVESTSHAQDMASSIGEEGVSLGSVRSVTKGFTTTSSTFDLPRKFFVDSDDSENDDDEDSATPTPNNFALRLKKDSLPRHHGFSVHFRQDLDDEEEVGDYEEEEEDIEDSDLETTDCSYVDIGAFAKKIPQPASHTRHTSLLSSMLAAPQPTTPPQSTTYLRSSQSVFKDLHAISDASHSQVKPLAVPYGDRNYIAPIRSPATIRRDILVTELSESLRRNLLWERQQRMWGQPRVKTSHYTVTALPKSNLAEPVLEKVVVESFRGW